MIHHCEDTLTDAEKLDVALYDAIVKNDVNEMRHIIHGMKRDLNDTFLIVRNKDHEYVSPMNLASWIGTAAIVKLLIESGCDVNKKGSILKRSPVHMAVLANNMGCLQILIKAQAKLDRQDVFGNTPCHYAAELGYLDVLDVMIRFGIQVNGQDIAAKTPLMKAVRNNRIESTLRLIRANADVNITDVNKDIALHFAARNGNVELVDILVSAGSLLDVQNIWGRSPLIEAVYYNKKEIVQCLLAAGCNINQRVFKTGETALHLAIRKKYIKVVQKLLEYILASPLHTINMLAMYDLDVSKFTCLLENEFKRKFTLFHMAAEANCFQTCHLLASIGYIDHNLRTSFQAIIENQDLSEVDRKSLQSILKTMTSVIPLKQTCRNVVRCSISNGLSEKVSTLSFPAPLRDYLLFKGEHAAYGQKIVSEPNSTS